MNSPAATPTANRKRLLVLLTNTFVREMLAKGWLIVRFILPPPARL
jgi:hypothetical protein